ncbi:hypothetical protein MUK42_35413 [Musa troglodytarum]|uniref:Uncharacterized protein n=1 Tax=Musa troglodytarum TaxID=320322 RepID=A0A9E7ECH0_9LILI|nr:hypothetical protein MUK42_35413 [Musa troglodytarum]
MIDRNEGIGETVVIWAEHLLPCNMVHKLLFRRVKLSSLNNLTTRNEYFATGSREVNLQMYSDEDDSFFTFVSSEVDAVSISTRSKLSTNTNPDGQDKLSWC